MGDYHRRRSNGEHHGHLHYLQTRCEIGYHHLHLESGHCRHRFPNDRGTSDTPDVHRQLPCVDQVQQSRGIFLRSKKNNTWYCRLLSGIVDY